MRNFFFVLRGPAKRAPDMPEPQILPMLVVHSEQLAQADRGVRKHTHERAHTTHTHTHTHAHRHTHSRARPRAHTHTHARAQTQIPKNDALTGARAHPADHSPARPLTRSPSRRLTDSTSISHTYLQIRPLAHPRPDPRARPLARLLAHRRIEGPDPCAGERSGWGGPWLSRPVLRWCGAGACLGISDPWGSASRQQSAQHTHDPR